MEQREAQIIESVKNCILMRGNKCSQSVLELMRDLQRTRAHETTKLFLRNGKELHPYEDISPVEQMCVKNNCSLFLCGTHQKKRPDNLYMGRTFANHILDLFEIGITNYIGLSKFNSKEIDNQIKPILMFQGEQFEFSTVHMRLKSYLQDFFRMSDYQEANINELKRVMVFTCTGEKAIRFNQYEVSEINVTRVHNTDLNLSEVGPRFTMNIRRDKIAADDLYKESLKQPKITNIDKKRAGKNKYTDAFGQQHGKVFIQHQDTKTLATRKWKKQPKVKEEAKDQV